MEHVTPFDWHRMFLGDEPPLYLAEILFRVVAVYAFAVYALRFMGQRGNQALSPFESVVIIALGSAAGDTMFYPQIPLLYAFTVIGLVIALERGSATAQQRWGRVNAFLEGEPMLVVRDGDLDEDVLRDAALRRDEFMALLRMQGIESVGEVRHAILERSGELSVFRRQAPVPGRSTWPDAIRTPTRRRPVGGEDR